MAIHKSVSELIGNTPLIELSNFEKNHDLGATVLGKVELFNPAGSVKDRIAKAMIDEAVKAGKVNDDTVFIEPTSGNTGIGLAAIAAARGNLIIITMPETMSIERRNLMKAYGAEVVLTDGSKGMKGAIAKAQELVDILVAGVGTGGTVTGTGRYLKSQNLDVKVVAVEPAGSPVLSEGHAGAHKIQGIGAGFIPETLDTSVFDEVIAVADEDAFETGRELAAKEGLLVGISSGAAVWAASQLAQRPENKGKTIVAILPDTGERYLSTAMFKFE